MALTSQAKTLVTKRKTVSCEGGSDDLSHPNVYLTLEKTGVAVCPYCSKKFKLKK